MLSWVFRHRARLRVIYGLQPLAEPVPCLPAAQLAESESGETGSERLAPGHWARRSRYVVLRPMPAHAV